MAPDKFATVADLKTKPRSERICEYPGATLGLGTSEVASLPDYTAAKERARQHRLDRAIMARAAHLKVRK